MGTWFSDPIPSRDSGQIQIVNIDGPVIRNNIWPIFLQNTPHFWFFLLKTLQIEYLFTKKKNTPEWHHSGKVEIFTSVCIMCTMCTMFTNHHAHHHLYHVCPIYHVCHLWPPKVHHRGSRSTKDTKVDFNLESNCIRSTIRLTYLNKPFTHLHLLHIYNYKSHQWSKWILISGAVLPSPQMIFLAKLLGGVKKWVKWKSGHFWPPQKSHLEPSERKSEEN